MKCVMIMIRFCNHFLIEVKTMRRRLFHGFLILVSTIMLLGLLSVGANAAGYPYGQMTFTAMPSNWQNVTVKVGNVTMPLSRSRG